MSTEALPPAEPDTRGRFRDRVREWRGESILQAVAELLSETGCLSFTMDDVAQRVGISKGSLYLHTATRSGLVESLLDRWEADVPPARDFGNALMEDRTERVCEALFHETDRGSGRSVPAFPCCLQTSPCPHGWSQRWARIAAAHGLSTDETEMLGEAVQALAGMGSVRALLREGNVDAALTIVRRFLVGYVATSTPTA